MGINYEWIPDLRWATVNVHLTCKSAAGNYGAEANPLTKKKNPPKRLASSNRGRYLGKEARRPTITRCSRLGKRPERRSTRK